MIFIVNKLLFINVNKWFISHSSSLCHVGFNFVCVDTRVDNVSPFLLLLRSAQADTAKLTGPRTFTDKRWAGPVKFLCIIMFNINKIRPKSLFGPVKAQKFSRCLHSWCFVIIWSFILKVSTCWSCWLFSRLNTFLFYYYIIHNNKKHKLAMQFKNLFSNDALSNRMIQVKEWICA